MMLDVSAVPGVLVFIDTSTSTGSVDQPWPKQDEHGKHKKDTQNKIFLISAPAVASTLSQPLAALLV